MVGLLEDLNAAQRRAVAHEPAHIQILAGPGSGKTRVLTRRVAYLLEHYAVPPSAVVCVTFTNKASREMLNRLSSLVGNDIPRKIAHLGTFHSMAAKYLRKYGKSVKINNAFTIVDPAACERVIQPIIAESKDDLSAAGVSVKPKDLLTLISKAKASSILPEHYCARTSGGRSLSNIRIGDVYRQYQEALQRDNSLDFDDLLLYFLQLVKAHSEFFMEINHVLVDEFQDTNTIQYEIVRHLAHGKKELTVVGDPDQSIYGWRNAQVGNLDLMTKDFHPVISVFLEENYRSCSSILNSAMAVVQQDKSRIAKTLKSTHPVGPPVSLIEMQDPSNEAAFIAKEIKKLIAHTGEVLGYEDFAILLRYGAISQEVERALRAKSIPCRMIGGHKFFDRVEVKDILAYLQLADNPDYTPALARVINIPRRGIGEKTLKTLQQLSTENDRPLYSLLKEAVLGKGPATKVVKGQSTKKISSFVDVIDNIRKLANEGTSVTEIIEFVCDKIKYQDYLKQAYEKDAMERWENIIELESYARNISESGNEENGFLDLGEGDEESPLRVFLAKSMLSTDTETEEAKADAKSPKVTISTVHAAKGLEWPVVFIPSVNDGVFPFYYAQSDQEVNEERRLLFVAMTRAQTHLFLSRASKRSRGSFDVTVNISRFVKDAIQTNPKMFAFDPPVLNKDLRKQVCSVLSREPKSEKIVAECISAYNIANPPPQSLKYGGAYEPGGMYSGMGTGINRTATVPTRASFMSGSFLAQKARSRSAFVSSAPDPRKIPHSSNFTSARNVHHHNSSTLPSSDDHKKTHFSQVQTHAPAAQDSSSVSLSSVAVPDSKKPFTTARDFLNTYKSPGKSESSNNDKPDDSSSNSFKRRKL